MQALLQKCPKSFQVPQSHSSPMQILLISKHFLTRNSGIRSVIHVEKSLMIHQVDKCIGTRKFIAWIGNVKTVILGSIENGISRDTW